MDVSARKILDPLKKGIFSPVYVLQGEETFYIDLISDFIENHFLAATEKSFNQVVLYGGESSVATILNHARRFPMMADRQVVIVKEAQEISDLNKDAGSKLLLSYLQQPVPSTLLVLCHKHKTFDRRKELGKRIDELTVSATFKKVYENQLPQFIREYVLAKGFQITEDGIDVLKEYIGNDLSRLANEIDKIIIGRNQETSISSVEIMAQVGVSREYSIFELQKAIFSKDPVSSFKIVSFYESNLKRNPVIPAVAFLYTVFSKLLLASSGEIKSENEIASALKISPFGAKDYSIALRKYSRESIREILSLIKNADLKLKGVNTTGEADGQVFRELVFSLIR